MLSMDGRIRDDLIRSILKRAREEGREGRVKMINDRLKAARDIPEDHRQILFELAMFGQVLPKSPFRLGATVH
jgi:hypothetical protein